MPTPRHRTLRLTSTLLLIASLLPAVGCGDDSGESPEVDSTRRTLTQSLTESMKFPNSEVVQQLLPDPDITMRLTSLDDDLPVVPDAEGMMSLQIQSSADPRAVATLIAFSVPGEDVAEGEGSHIVVPVPDDQSSTLIENEFSVDDELCKDACDAVFQVTVTQAVELEDGSITQPVDSSLIVDCVGHGDPDNCSDDDPVIDPCGDASSGGLVYTRSGELDALFSAGRKLADATTALQNDYEDVLDALADGLGLDGDSDAAAVAEAFAARVDAHTEGGLAVIFGKRGCAVPTRALQRVLRDCHSDDNDLDGPLPCEGECRARGEAGACEDGDARCRGLIEDAVCDGNCAGSCRVTLDEPGPCIGTCIGSCSGECPAGDETACEGPCVGDCDGECREPFEGDCGGLCSGLCDEAGGGECAEGLLAACVSDAPSDCAGLCFGIAELGGSALCTQAALAIAHAKPFCEPSLVQVSFSFLEGLEPDAQAAFAAWVTELGPILVDLFGLFEQVEDLAGAAAALDDARGAEAEGTLAALMAASPDDDGLRCAEDELGGLATRLADDLDQLSDAQSDTMQLVSPLGVEVQ